MLRKSGIYGLFSFVGAPIDPADAEALGLAVPPHPANRLVEGFDRQADAVSWIENEAGVTVLVGEVEDGADLARSLGLSRTAEPAAIAQAALIAYGPQLPACMIGEYSCVSADRAGKVTLVQSAALRDPLHYAIGDRCVAISPAAFALARLPWVGRDLDPVGLATYIGQASTRLLRDNRTILQRVCEVLPGETVQIAPDGQVRRAMADLFEPVPRFIGTRADALAAAEAMLDEILGGHMARSSKPAILLSGGLDSSVLAMFMARMRGAGQTVGAVTSVAPPGSGLVDETAEAGLVAQVLGLEHQLCWPRPEANPYVPRPSLYLGRDGPLLSNRHALTDAMQDVAHSCGITSMLNGTFGEGSVTAREGMTPAKRSLGGRLRGLARRALDQITHPEPRGLGTHARLAPDLRASLQASLAVAPDQPPVRAAEDGLFGYSLTVLKALPQPTEYEPGAIRMDYPFRDLRLLRLFASFPRSFLCAEDGNREFARHLMAGRLPDAIRLRQDGRPASPDHPVRLRAFAPATRELIGSWRAAGAGDWVDLAWLDRSLARVAQEEPRYSTFGTEVQITAMTAAFFAWWHQQEQLAVP